MITETFLNSCYGLLFGPNHHQLDMSDYQDLLNFFDQSKKHFYEGDLAVDVLNKQQLIQKTCEHMLKGGTMVELITSVAISEKFKEHMGLINLCEEGKMGEPNHVQWQKTIQKLIAFCKLNTTFQRFDKYREIVLDGTFDTIEDVIDEWADIVKTSASAVADYELKTRSDLVSSFNTRTDGLDSLIREIRKKYSKANVVPSGIPELDIEFLNGGFQPSRVHLFGGTSGSGKSVLLLNFAKRAAMITPPSPFTIGSEIIGLDDTPERVFLYVTMENYVYETWVRLYCSLFNKTKEEMLQLIYNQEMTSENIREQINEIMAPYNSSIQIEYFPAQTISPATISSLIGKLNEHPDQRTVKAVYIDYLDLMVTDQPKEFYRMELGEITSRLKTIAANFEIPIITATQLNREAYRKGKGSEVGSEMISESIQKLFIADFSAMMYWDNPDDKTGAEDVYMPQKVVLKIDKNRDGKTGKTHIYMNYPQSRFLTQQEHVDEYRVLLEI
jgi:replicative DNA helicase